ncbi:MAG: hypothetical protein R3C05_12640 [Pirellulaceae bacterium]
MIVAASGPEAGKMFGTDETSFEIGDDASCLIRLPRDEARGDAELCVRVQRGIRGWTVQPVAGGALFVNQTRVIGNHPLDPETSFDRHGARP